MRGTAGRKAFRALWGSPLLNVDHIALGYPGLFPAALVAATLLPAQSELLLLAMLATKRFEPGLLLLAVSLGNVLGSTINWALGRFLARHRGSRWGRVPGRGVARRW